MEAAIGPVFSDRGSHADPAVGDPAVCGVVVGDSASSNSVC